MSGAGNGSWPWIAPGTSWVASAVGTAALHDTGAEDVLAFFFQAR